MGVANYKKIDFFRGNYIRKLFSGENVSTVGLTFFRIFLSTEGDCYIFWCQLWKIAPRFAVVLRGGVFPLRFPELIFVPITIELGAEIIWVAMVKITL